jgi:hypothetical protein
MMEFKSRTLESRGEVFRLRELSAAQVAALGAIDDEYNQSLALVGLSLCTEAGEPLFSTLQVLDAVDYVGSLPVGVINADLIPAASELNEVSLDDARKN